MPDLFPVFWSAYPRHTAKKDAEKAWRQVQGDRHLDAILEALAWQREQESWQKDGGAFIPYPASYLRGERWEDEAPRVESQSFAVREARAVLAAMRTGTDGPQPAGTALNGVDTISDRDPREVRPRHVSLVSRTRPTLLD